MFTVNSVKLCRPRIRPFPFISPIVIHFPLSKAKGWTFIQTEDGLSIHKLVRGGHYHACTDIIINVAVRRDWELECEHPGH